MNASFPAHLIRFLGLLLVGLTSSSLFSQDSPVETAAEAPASAAASTPPVEQDVTQGALRIVQKDGAVVECPLKHTDVLVDIAGFVARVKVIQTFHNPLNEKIEAVYVFPLPHEAAVDEMTMVIGDRRIVGLIKRRAEARQIYEQALAAGQTAALLEQERPNIFTQSVGNIDPQQEVKIEISYVDVLRYDVGSYEFQFPMVVGPRYIPGQSISTPGSTPPELANKVSPPAAGTTRVPDASRISPPVLRPDVRNGHDISVSVKLDAGVPVQDLVVANHKTSIQRDGDHRASIVLDPSDSIPNKDFVLRYDVTGAKPEMAMLAHTGSYTDSRRLGSGYFLLMVQPQEDERLTKSPPREIVFLVDVSGSMSGEPTAKVIETMQNMLKMCRPQDTLQLVTFAGDANKLFEKPVPVSEESIARALNFTSGFAGSGGTEMLKGVQMAIDEPIDQERLRIVVMLTDGYIGNEAEIIEHVGKRCGDQIRFWCVGIGAAPNMFLVDGVAKQGGGMGKQLGLQDDAAALSQEIMTRIQRAQLAKIQIDWGGLQVAETYPARIPELWAGRPVILCGRYAGGGQATITVRGVVEGEEVSWPLSVALPQQQAEHDALAKIWARRKIEDLMQQAFYQDSPAVEEAVTAIALDYQLMSQYTSFVAVDENDVQSQPSVTPPRRMLVPVPLPQGTRWEGFFGPLAADREDAVALEAAGRYSNLRDGTSRIAAADSFFKYSRNSGAASGGPAQANFAPLFSRAALLPGKRLNEAKSGNATLRGRQLSLGRRVASESRGGQARVLTAEGLSLAADFDESAPAGLGDTFIERQADQLAPAAQQLFETGQQARTKKNVAQARLALTHAFFLDYAASKIGYSSGDIAAQSLAILGELRTEQILAWKKELPNLNQQLDLVLRKTTIAAALQAIAQSADVDIQLIDGSIADAMNLVSPDGIRVDYLDLRGATVADALDWLLQPAGLTWQANQQSIVAGSERRMLEQSAWVYDVSVMALPDPPAAPPQNNAGDLQTELQKAGDEFLAAVREALAMENDTVRWIGGGELLVVGGKDLHQRTAKLLQSLADPQAKLTGSAAKLQRTTSARASERRQKLAQQELKAHRAFIASKHVEFGWRLLAAAAAGRLDEESFVHLQIAWEDPATAEMLKDRGAGVALRSLWILSEVERAVAPDDELSALVKSARSQSQPAMDQAIESLQKNPADASAYGSALYAALAGGDDAYLRQALPLLTAQRPDDSPVKALTVISKVLLAKADKADQSALEALVRSGVQGDDQVLLLALACHRAGDSTKSLLQAEAPALLGNQPLTGDVVVLINRLTGSALAQR